MSAFQSDTKYYDRPQAGSLEEDFTIPAGGTGRKPHSFALSPEMDYRSGCGTAEFGTTFRPVSYGANKRRDPFSRPLNRWFRID